MSRAGAGWVLGAGLILLCARPGVAAQEVTEPDPDEARAEAAAEPAPGAELAAEDGGAGTVIELDNTGTGADAEYQPRELADSDVEMIIGGAGKDGVARRGRLKKED